MLWSSSRSRATLATAAALALGAFALEAAACRMPEPRGHTVRYPSYSAAFEPPHETNMHPGDLLSVAEMPGASYRVIAQDAKVSSTDENVPNLVPLSEERFQKLRADGVGPRDVEIPLVNTATQTPLKYLRYGASGPGTFWLVSTRDNETWAERLAVVPHPVKPSGSDVTVDENKSAAGSAPTYLNYEDRLIIEIPGSLADGWQIKVSEDKFAVVRLEPAAVAGRLRVHLERRPSTYPSGSFEVSISRGLFDRQQFQFVLMPIPKC
jgi:hypothetical protein